MIRRSWIVAVTMYLPLFCLNAMPAVAQEEEAPGVVNHGRVEGTGYHFEITDSDYLNLTLDSTEEITIVLTSVPETATLHVEESTTTTSTQITLSGFEPSTTYHRYVDDFQNHTEFRTDGSGNYTFTQNLGSPCLVIFTQRPSTKYIPNDTNIGTWDPVTRTYTLNQDVYDTIQIQQDNLTLDGAGHTVRRSSGGFSIGIYLPYRRKNVTIKNLTVENFSYGFYLNYADYNTIENVTVRSSLDTGILLWSSFSNTIQNTTAELNRRYGIFVYRFSRGNTIRESTVQNNRSVGIWVRYYSHSNTVKDNTISGNGSVGVYFHDTSMYCKAVGNTISNNQAGFYAYRSKSGEVYNNSFISNISYQAKTDLVSSVKFYKPKPVGGNHWSNHTIPDNDGDGFVDISFTDTGVFDQYPWTTPGGWANQPPVADAGPDQTVECTGAHTGVTLDGSGSSDPDGDTLTYTWREGTTVLAGPSTNPISVVTLGLGSHTISLDLSDGQETVTEDIVVEVVDTTPPVVVITSPAEGATFLSKDQINVAFTVTEVCDASPTVTVTPEDPPWGPPLAVGTLTITVTAVTVTGVDEAANTGSASITVTIDPIEPAFTLDPNTLNINNANGRVTGYIELPPGCGTCEDIDLASILLHGPEGGTAAPITDPKFGFVKSLSSYCVDSDGDGILERLVKWERSDVVAIAGDVRDASTFAVAGQLLPTSPFGTAAFAGIDVIRVTANGGGNELASDGGSGTGNGNSKGKGKAGKPVLLLDGLDARVAADLTGRTLEGPAVRNVLLEPVRQTFALYPNYPNPFNPMTTIHYTLAEASDVRLTIYNAHGQLVRVLFDGGQGSGVYRISWDGQDDAGRQVSSGIYLYMLQAGSNVSLQKMILAK